MERIVSPQLGSDNLSAAFMSCMIGLVVVAIFLLAYYYVTGGVAMVAVLMNMIIIVGVLALFGTTFTLPGIAGMVLTLGSAVDANVLIYERLREEQQRGLSVRLAVRNAYDRAFSAILDSNVITIITSVILYWFGTEEVKGFGLTLLIGIASSLFTALFVTRTIFDLMLERGHSQPFGSLPLTFPKWQKLLHPNFDWIRWAWVGVTFSGAVLTIGTIMYLVQGRNMYDIEFASGTSVQFELKEPATRAQVVEWLEKSEAGKAEKQRALPAVQAVAIGGTGDMQYEVITPNNLKDEVRVALEKALKGRLKVDEPSKYDSVDLKYEQAWDHNSIRAINNNLLSTYPWARNKLQANMGGVLIDLKNLDPKLTPQQLSDRLKQGRMQAGRKAIPGKIEIEVPGDRKLATSDALVLVSAEGLSYDSNSSKWESELARPMWELVKDAINKPVAFKSVSSFDPQVARTMMWAAISSLGVSLVLIMAYLWLRFGNIKYGSATVVAMIHDALFVIGGVGLAHLLANTWFGRNVLLLEPFRMNLTMVAGVLTVMSYSMMDTIVVFDRIRENRGKYGYINRQVINDSINQTLSRTMLTLGITLAMVFVMYVFGGPGLHGFTFTLLIGILSGSYSTVAIAAPMLLWSGKDVQRPGMALAQVSQPPAAQSSGPAEKVKAVARRRNPAARGLNG